MHLTTNKGFNPRLPLLGGDAAPISFLLRRNTVSIHASRCWEAMPDKTMRVADNHEVSIHASRCWEAMHLSPVQSVVVVPVSIHASRCWEAMRAIYIAGRPTRRFQSTPPVAGRRCFSFPTGSVVVVDVSIHASRCWEAMHILSILSLLGITVSIHASRCWEAMRGGSVGYAVAKGVSIHASRCWEAMHDTQPSGIDTRVFQSTPPVAGRRCGVVVWNVNDATKFQSTPPVAGRRCLRTLQDNTLLRYGFNPRLPLLGGDATLSLFNANSSQCFNPRLPLLGGDARR